MRTLQCPSCQKPVEWTTAFPFRPFCSERCRTIDLGAWADNRYSVPINTSVDVDTEDLEDTKASDTQDSESENEY
jgi:endogenous inhibitor of DNA gyrase (YacG/DUF329 family)